MLSKCQGEGRDIFCPSSLLALTAWVYSEPDPMPAAWQLWWDLLPWMAPSLQPQVVPGATGEKPPLRARRGTGEHQSNPAVWEHIPAASPVPLNCHHGVKRTG